MLQLQAIVGHLQGKIGLFVLQRQPQTLSPLHGLILSTHRQGFNPDATARLLLTHSLHTLKKC
ncbi:hypothetical protein PSCICJ_20400 [Pseudomonas cichorii]|nr:hypothetical protein PSCICJ_20400 [Pseudomonas cichorii]